MGISQLYDFDNILNFTASNTVISAGKAKLGLISNPNQVFAEDFTDNVGFTYDALKASFAAGLVLQSSQLPSSSFSALFSTFTSSMDANWYTANTSLAANLIGVPTLSGGKLDCTGATNKGLYYSNAVIGNLAGSLSLKFKYTPNYTTAPATYSALFSFTNGTNNNDLIRVYHENASNRVRISAYNNIGTLIHSGNIFGSWAPTAGQEYEIEVCVDAGGTGNIRMFIDGVLLGTVNTIYTRGTSAVRLYLGSDTLYVTDASFNDISLYSNVQHTTNYTAGYSIPEAKYVTSLVQGPSFTYTGIGTIQSVDTASIVEVGTPRYIVAGKYWDGLAWSTSNNSYAQANSFATVLANLGAFVAGGGTVPWSIVFPDSNTLSSVSDFSVTVTGQRYSPTGYIEPAQALQVKDLIAYSQVHTEDADTDIRVILKIDGVLKYWNGLAWATSNGTIAQANTAEDLNTNLATLDLGVNSTVYIRWLMSTSVATSTPELDTATMTYDFGAIETALITCILFGYLKNISDSPVADAIVRFELESKTDIYKEANNNVIHTGKVEVTTDVNGYFALPLVRSSEFTDTTRYKITIIKNGTIAKTSTGSKLYFSVPDADTKDITDLLPIV